MALTTCLLCGDHKLGHQRVLDLGRKCECVMDDVSEHIIVDDRLALILLS